MKWPWTKDKFPECAQKEVRRLREKHRAMLDAEKGAYDMVLSLLESMGELDEGERWADDLPQRIAERVRCLKSGVRPAQHSNCSSMLWRER